MKKLLIITDLLQASPRIPGLVKYLPKLGWECIILTPNTSVEFSGKFSSSLNFQKKGIKVIQTAYPERFTIIKKLLGLKGSTNFRNELNQKYNFKAKSTNYLFNLIGAIINYPDADKNWYHIAFEEAGRLINSEKIDFILSSSSPVTAHLIANAIKRRYNIPWVADLRDLWSQNHNYYYPLLRKWIDRSLELKTLSQADALITVSSPWAEKLNRLHIKKKVFSITNGFDPEYFKQKIVKLTSFFSITYTGNLYQEKQDVTQFFSALSNLIKAKKINTKDILVRFFGPQLNWVQQEIDKYQLQGIVKQYGIISRKEVKQRQKESQILLLSCWRDKDEKGCYPLKTFEYLLAQRPILAVGGSGNDVVEEILDITHAGYYSHNRQNIESILENLYNKYKKNKTIIYQGNKNNIKKYGYDQMAKRFSIIFNEILGISNKREK